MGAVEVAVREWVGVFLTEGTRGVKRAIELGIAEELGLESCRCQVEGWDESSLR